MAEVLLEAQGLGKRFGGLQALEDVGLTIHRGEIFGLIGPNGAGKTTLFNVLTGLYRPDAGRFRFRGHELGRCKPHAIAEAGIARTFQNIRLFAHMSALENVMVGRHVRTHGGVFGAILRTPGQRREEREITEHALALLDYVGIARHADTLARHLSYGDQRRLELARALATEPHLLALDEPVAGMNPREREDIAALLRRIREERATVLIIEHDVKLVMGLCDRVAVLDHGRKIAEGVPEAVQRDPAVIEAYLGRGAA